MNRRAFIQQLGLGALVSKALDGDVLSRKLLQDFQKRLQAQGVEIAWPKLTPR